MEARPDEWPEFNNELLPNILFKLAAQFPGITYAEYPQTNNIADGYRKITFKEMACAVHEMAWWIDQKVGKPAKDDGSETLVYMGPNDVRYGILVLSSVMVGYKMLFPTPRYGVEATNALISIAGGSVMLLPSQADPIASEIVARRSMQSHKIPNPENLLTSKPEPYPYEKTFEANRNEPLVCLHTSGTSGFPKPVIWTHEWADSVAKGHRLPAPAGYELTGGNMFASQKRVMTLFPRMHASGVITATIFPLCLGITMVHPPFRATPNEAVEAAVEALETVNSEDNVHSLAVPPPHAEYISATPSMVERLRKKVPMIMWSGGTVSDASGNVLAAKLQVHNFLASTEAGIFNTIRKSDSSGAKTVQNEFQYFTFHPALNIRFDAVSECEEEGMLYEAKMRKNQEENAWVQPIFKIFTKANEISLGDMFVRHPHDYNKWKYAGRADDMLTFLGGENFYPSVAERRIAEYPGIVEAIILGTRRPRASLVIRLNNGSNFEDAWETVEKVNQDAPVYARVAKHMIVLAKLPFPRTAKGSVQRTGTTRMYEKELDALYEKDRSLT
ncbi:thioester reductase domain-containing protein [Stagonosporopsis vannaccii]|nr:thioester reductase domain-containing protein [Stagonosporopsis vannaccii]